MSNPKVIIVDDNKYIRVALKKALEPMGFDIINEGENGKEAEDLVRQYKPDIILLDINMPIKTGDEVIDQLLSYHPELIIIMVSSVSDKSKVDECLDLGASNYIVKDNGLDLMVSTIAETWDLNKIE